MPEEKNRYMWVVWIVIALLALSGLLIILGQWGIDIPNRYEKFRPEQDQKGTILAEKVYAECICVGGLLVQQSYPPRFNCWGFELCRDVNYTRVDISSKSEETKIIQGEAETININEIHQETTVSREGKVMISVSGTNNIVTVEEGTEVISVALYGLDNTLRIPLESNPKIFKSGANNSIEYY